MSFREEGKSGTHTQRRALCKDTGTEEDGHVKVQTEIGVVLPQAKGHLELPDRGGGGGKEGSSSLTLLLRRVRQRECDPANTLTLAFWPPELGDNLFLLLQAIPFLVLGHISLRKLTQHSRGEVKWAFGYAGPELREWLAFKAIGLGDVDGRKG